MRRAIFYLVGRGAARQDDGPVPNGQGDVLLCSDRHDGCRVRKTENYVANRATKTRSEKQYDSRFSTLCTNKRGLSVPCAQSVRTSVTALCCTYPERDVRSCFYLSLRKHSWASWRKRRAHPTLLRGRLPMARRSIISENHPPPAPLVRVRDDIRIGQVLRDQTSRVVLAVSSFILGAMQLACSPFSSAT